MKRTRSVFLALAGSAGFAALVVAACGSDYEVNDDFCRRNPNHPECPPPGFAGSSGASGTAGQGPGGTSGNAGQGPGGSAGVSGSGGSGGGASGTGGSGPMPTVCDPAEQPNDAKGVFVDASAPAGGKGTRAEPYSSLPAAVAALTNLPSASGATLYLRQGAAPYALDATLALPAMTEGVGLVLDGGWGENWQRDCSDEAASKTIVSGKSATASPVLRAEGGSLTLRRLTVRTVEAAPPTAQAQSGASLTAVYVAGNTSLLVEAAALRAGIAGDGGAAPTSQPVSGPRACNGLTDCQTGASVTTPAPAGG
ncbi:MAG: hypothetical protein MUF34_32055, partial [Polyangiaceae bacterium]|nr:hypothetical protein [Polyangiaceae bacterium]